VNLAHHFTVKTYSWSETSCVEYTRHLFYENKLRVLFTAEMKCAGLGDWNGKFEGNLIVKKYDSSLIAIPFLYSALE
jgi:hypothetical protein